MLKRDVVRVLGCLGPCRAEVSRAKVFSCEEVVVEVGPLAILEMAIVVGVVAVQEAVANYAKGCHFGLSVPSQLAPLSHRSSYRWNVARWCV